MRTNNIIKRTLFLILLSLVMINAQAQTGLNFQGVARTSNNVILASQAITIKLSILQGSSTGTADYIETRKVNTNAQGLFTAVIGDTGAISTLGNFTTINWKISPKFLKIEMDPAAGANFITMGTTQFQYVAYAQFAKSVDAENIVGIVPVTLGGTGVASLVGLKTALTLNNVNNTTDLTKPISTLTQTALDLKLNKSDTINFTKQTYSDSSLLTKLKISDTSAMLSSRIKRDTLNLSNRINLKANSSDITSSLLLKENTVNKSTAADLGAVATSDILYPSQKAVKAYVDAQINSGGVADGGITTSKLAAGSVTDAKIASGIDKAKVGLENVDNTSDADKPISNAVQTALDNKASNDLRSLAKLNEENYFEGNQIIYGDLNTTGTLTLGGTRIESGINSETTILNRHDADFSIISSDEDDQYNLKFTSDGSLEIGYNFRILTSGEINMFGQDTATIRIIKPCDDDDCDDIFKLLYENDIEIESKDNLWLTAGQSIRISGEDVIVESVDLIKLKTGIDENTNQWIFDEEGILTFPDGTIVSGNISSTASLEYDVVGFGFEAINLKPFIIQTKIYDDDNDINQVNQWMFDVFGNIQFPGNSTELGNRDDGFGFSLGGRNFAVYSASENGGGLLTFKTDGTLNLSYAETNLDESTIITKVSMGVISNTSFNIEYPGEISFTNEAGKLSFEENGSIAFPDLTVASGNISNTGNFGFDTSPTNGGFSIITAGTSTGTSQLWTFDTNGVLNLPTGGDIKIGGTSVLSANSNFFTEEFAFAGRTHESTYGYGSLGDNLKTATPSNYYSEEVNSILIPLLHPPKSIDQISVILNNVRISKDAFGLSSNIIYLNNDNFGNFQSSSYSLFIDYQY